MKHAEAQNPSIRPVRPARPVRPVRLARPLVLVGLMGAGKSKIGRMLATRLGTGFADLDTEIEAAAGLTITTIFEDYGEEKFRALETSVLKRMLGTGDKGDARIISLGGGTFLDAGNRALIAAHALSLWLKAAPETLAARISNTDSRPLLKGRDAAAVLRDLAEKRYPIYGEADIVVDTDGLEPPDALEKTAAALTAHLEAEAKEAGEGAP